MWACIREHGSNSGACEWWHHVECLEKQVHSKRFRLYDECLEDQVPDHLNSCVEEQQAAWFALPGPAVNFASYPSLLLLCSPAACGSYSDRLTVTVVALSMRGAVVFIYLKELSIC
jgi:hypothetical protein